MAPPIAPTTATVSRHSSSKIPSPQPITAPNRPPVIAITGGLLGAVIGCGEGIFDDECRDTVAVVGAIGGAIIGNAVASRLGDHNGFQYVVDIDDSDEDISIVQSGYLLFPSSVIVFMLGAIFSVKKIDGSQA